MREKVSKLHYFGKNGLIFLYQGVHMLHTSGTHSKQDSVRITMHLTSLSYDNDCVLDFTKYAEIVC